MPERERRLTRTKRLIKAYFKIHRARKKRIVKHRYLFFGAVRVRAGGFQAVGVAFWAMYSEF